MYLIKKNLKNDEEMYHQVSTENDDQVADVAPHVDDDYNTQVIKNKFGSSWQTLTLSPKKLLDKYNSKMLSNFVQGLHPLSYMVVHFLHFVCYLRNQY